MGLLFTLIFLSPLFILSPASATELDTTRRALAGTGNCNIFRGKWVYDASYPLYDFSSCAFIDDQYIEHIVIYRGKLIKGSNQAVKEGTTGFQKKDTQGYELDGAQHSVIEDNVLEGDTC
ncbi:hypothetical protein SASPL_137765 [Salvia splendens]|uniref:Trichome birefringence-like N-terminal domain-containing protein n=1 Tax=Salvia splendens TaxID=180675 RepID=A0A8X8WSA3_SALSN|nr:hypothetical protein SASPL_137765 [Salvia splendens]